MGKVVMYSSVSVDGFVADGNDQPGPLFDWLSSAWPGCSRRNRRRTSTYRVGVSPVNARNVAEVGLVEVACTSVAG